MKEKIWKNEKEEEKKSRKEEKFFLFPVPHKNSLKNSHLEIEERERGAQEALQRIHLPLPSLALTDGKPGKSKISHSSHSLRTLSLSPPDSLNDKKRKTFLSPFPPPFREEKEGRRKNERKRSKKEPRTKHNSFLCRFR